MNGEFKRGEIYWVTPHIASGEFEGADGYRRPMLIVSHDKNNETWNQVLCVQITSQFRWGVLNVKTYATGRESYIKCNHIHTILKTRIDAYIATLSEEEMEEVDRGLMAALQLTPQENTEEIEKLEAKIKELETQITTFKEEKAKIAVENTVKNDMWQRLYDKALDELVAVKVTGDIDRLTKIAEEAKNNKVAVTDTVEKAEAKPEVKVEVKPAEEAKNNKVEINTCSEADLHGVGCNARQITSIIANRPYKSVDDLRRVPWITNTAYAILKTKVCCEPIIEKPKFKMTPAPNKEIPPADVKEENKASGRVNLNTATVEQLVKYGGVKESVAIRICDYRAKHGRFSDIKELLKIDRIGEAYYKRYVDKFEV